jgi:hypothetical protein
MRGRLSEEVRAKMSANHKARWPPEKRKEASVKAKMRAQVRTQARITSEKEFRRLKAILPPLRQKAYNECFANKWPYVNLDERLFGWDGEFYWGRWCGSFGPPRKEPLSDEVRDRTRIMSSCSAGGG